MHAGAGAEVHDVVRLADRILVVLNDDDGVAEVAQAVERVGQALVVALVQADEDSSKKYMTPTSPEPIWLASRMRCASPPESVSALRSSVR